MEHPLSTINLQPSPYRRCPVLTLRRFFATLGPGVLWLAVFLIVPALVMLGTRS